MNNHKLVSFQEKCFCVSLLGTLFSVGYALALVFVVILQTHFD